MLSVGSSLGSTPLPNQNSGRHSMSSKSSMSLYESAAEGTIGRIQVGAVSGASAQGIGPACWAPVAPAGIVPNAPPSAVDGVVLPPEDLPPLELLQATTSVVAQSAAATVAVDFLSITISLPQSSARLPAPEPDIQGVAKRVPDEVARHHRGHDAEADGVDKPPVAVQHVRGAVGHHVAPVEARVVQPEAEEAQVRDGQDRVRDVERDVDDDHAECVRQQVPVDQPPAARSGAARRL